MSHQRVIWEGDAMAITQLTVRGFDKALERRLREEARAGGLSLTRAAIKLMRKGAGLDEGTPVRGVGPALDHLIGTWSPADARALADATAVFERVDKDFWE
jgi:hypothetical protein